MENTAPLVSHSADQIGFAIVGVAALLIFGALILAVFNASTPRRAFACLVALLIAIAALPFWGSLLFTIVGSFQTNSSGYWAAAPWIIIYATIVYSAMSIAVAAVTGIVYIAVRGEPAQKMKWTLLALGVSLVVAGFFLNQRRDSTKRVEANVDAQRAAVEDFVRHHDVVTRKFPEKIYVFASRSTSREFERLPFRYLVSVFEEANPAHRMSVVVYVTRSDAAASYKLTCVVDENVDDWVRAERCQAR